MLAGITRHFSTIRWKLTGAFMAVSLLLALTMIATLLGAIFYFLSAPVIPQALAESARDLARGLSRELAGPSGSPERLFAILNNFETTGTAPLGSPAGGASIRGDGEDRPRGDELLVALLDNQGRVITSTRPLAYPAGLSLSFVEPEPSHDLVVQALAGVTETARLGAWSAPEHQPIAVAPIFDSAGAVSGVVYLRLVNFPPVGLLFANLTPIIVTFILPWLLVSGGLGMLYAWLVGRGFARRIVRLTEASVDLSDGSLSRRIEDPSGDELGQLGRQFNAMADQLSESLRSLRLLADKNAQLAEQAAQLAAVEERNHLARELHDSVSQELFSLTMLAAAARRTLDSNPRLAAERLIEIEESARRALEETRSLIFALRPAALDDRGLAPALRDLARALEERQGLALTLRVTGERRLPLEHEQALFRIVQEAVANVARHSGVRAAEVELCYGDSMVTLAVRDGGRGFDPAAARNPRAIGLLSMAERAEALGGAFQILSEPGGGARILVALPAGDGFRARPADPETGTLEQDRGPGAAAPLPVAERNGP